MRLTGTVLRSIFGEVILARPGVLRDPIHLNIELDRDNGPEQLALKLIDCAELQRLRQVRQLGLANLVYHGAEHSRFIHSLGVAAVAKRMHVSAIQDSNGVLSDDTLTVVLASALLHDVGHPPFSHAVEQQLGVDHEDLSIAVVKGDTQVHQVLYAHGGEQLVDRVAGHIRGTSDEPTTQFISSQLDADRADYILRDGYYAGVPNSQFDIARIIQLLYVDNQGLWFDGRAQTAIEGYFIARYHLYLQLYYHKTVRSAEAMLRSLLQRARKLREDGHDLDQISESVRRLFSGEAAKVAVHLTDYDLWAAFHAWADSTDPVIKSLSLRLRNRDLQGRRGSNCRIGRPCYEVPSGC